MLVRITGRRRKFCRNIPLLAHIERTGGGGRLRVLVPPRVERRPAGMPVPAVFAAVGGRNVAPTFTPRRMRGFSRGNATRQAVHDRGKLGKETNRGAGDGAETSAFPILSFSLRPSFPPIAIYIAERRGHGGAPRADRPRPRRLRARGSGGGDGVGWLPSGHRKGRRHDTQARVTGTPMSATSGRAEATRCPSVMKS